MLPLSCTCAQLGGYAFIGEGIPVGLGAAFTSAYKKVRRASCWHALHQIFRP
jgi:hypothetical protein